MIADAKNKEEILTWALGKLLRQYRIDREITQNECAKSLGFKQCHISRLENGVSQNGTTITGLIVAIAIYMDVSEDRLVGAASKLIPMIKIEMESARIQQLTVGKVLKDLT